MRFAADLHEPEGPVLLFDGSWLVCEMAKDRGCISQLSSDGKSKRVVAQTGRPNGLAIDRRGVIWAAESLRPSLLRVTLDGQVEVALTGCGDEPLLFPNDLAIGPDGALYMTDSGILHGDWAPGGTLRSDYDRIPVDGRVYRIDTQTLEVTKIDTGILFANGIAFDANANLYANETVTGAVFRYRSQPGGTFGPRELFGNVVDPAAGPGYKGPDGMKFGLDGNLYVTVFGQQDVTVLGRDGEVVSRIRTMGRRPTNVAFGPRGSRRLFVTEVELGAMEAHDVETDGLGLFV